jgi:hypothetical protein
MADMLERLGNTREGEVLLVPAGSPYRKDRVAISIDHSVRIRHIHSCSLYTSSQEDATVVTHIVLDYCRPQS